MLYALIVTLSDSTSFKDSACYMPLIVTLSDSTSFKDSACHMPRIVTLSDNTSFKDSACYMPNEHNCFITLIFLKYFTKPRTDRYIFLLNVYFVKIKNKHFNYFCMVSNFLDNVLFTLYKLAVTMQDNVILLHD